MKLSNVWKAWMTTLIGALIGILTLAAEMFMNGTFTWKTFLVAAVPFVIGAFTDLLNEVKKEITHEQDEPAAPKVTEPSNQSA